ncbi:MAG: hypothetical protein ACRD4B_09680 [Acidobacteriota bacterium]
MLKQKLYKHLLFAILVATLAFTFVSCSEDDDEFPGGGRVTDVELSVDTPNFTGVCPKTIRFTGLIETNGAGLITYIWERSTGNSNPININLPVPGGIIVTDDITVTTSGTVTVTLHVTRPNDITSAAITSSITCQ